MTQPRQIGSPKNPTPAVDLSRSHGSIGSIGSSSFTRPGPLDSGIFSTSESEADDLPRDRFGARVQKDASVLYAKPARRGKTRTFSESGGVAPMQRQRNLYGVGGTEDAMAVRARRMSHDEQTLKSRKFLVDVEETMRLVLDQEDTDGNFQIAVTDAGPKVLSLGTETSNGYRTFEIRGTYMLSNLLQELALARDHGLKQVVLDENRLHENPVSRLSRMISHSFWNNLTRRMDRTGIEAICADPKNRGRDQTPYIYVPEVETEMLDYYRKMAEENPQLNLRVEALPTDWDVQWVKDRNDRPGTLALAMDKDANGNLVPLPFIVPGARFNELYNWDSYFISLGLIADERFDLARCIVEHFLFEIKHYRKILNGSRSYYLPRSQPPFLTDLILQVYPHLDPATPDANKVWLRRALNGAISEYHSVWMAQPRMDPVSGLSRFRPDGLGIPPETEASHFNSVLQPYADALGISVNEFIERYNDGEVKEPALDEYFLHDRAVRESGHDTTYRFEKRCANLGTIDLCSLLYKYEVDIATMIRDFFDDDFELGAGLEDHWWDYTLQAYPFGSEVPHTSPLGYVLDPEIYKERPAFGTHVHSAEWFARAQRRTELVDHYLWHEGRGLYTDYDTVRRKQSLYESVTTFWPLWCGLASEQQAERIVRMSLPKFEEMGGLVSGTEGSRGRITLQRPNRQWDYPAAWPPHQVMAWVGLQKYGYEKEAQRLAYRWLYMVTRGFVEAGGVVPEKFNAVQCNSHIDAEYGNQGTEFRMIPKEGFGWTNASYQVGLSVITPYMRRALGTLTSPETFFGTTNDYH